MGEGDCDGAGGGGSDVVEDDHVLKKAAPVSCPGIWINVTNTKRSVRTETTRIMGINTLTENGNSIFSLGSSSDGTSSLSRGDFLYVCSVSWSID
ncbi:MAG: hypothetical protein UW94_C0009G0028 [Parcubacteria group bacterium GW2011_GWA2_45_14]|nr:MAG: hypothetical protein UW94_C0009G0028 [Parcubacteria group bacterium GW2011_GWA2_45_14]